GALVSRPVVRARVRSRLVPGVARAAFVAVVRVMALRLRRSLRRGVLAIVVVALVVVVVLRVACLVVIRVVVLVGRGAPIAGVGAVVGSVVAVLIPAVRRGHAGGVAPRGEVSVATLPVGEVRPRDWGEQQDGGQPEDEG